MNPEFLAHIQAQRAAQGLTVKSADGNVLTFSTHAAKEGYLRRRANAERSQRFGQLSPIVEA